MTRLLDIFFSSVAMIILFPLLLPILLVLRFSGEGEVFYVQQRIGYKGDQFGVFKFATMLKNSPNIGAGEITLKEDPRVLPIGRFLRKSKLNELPQLWNIFIGDMSIVGPRPMVQNTFQNYSETTRLKLNTVRPGLTGIGSIFFAMKRII
jgi:lipopolysaccharide/colanic/teichoic acid biosynthesis glycosyltransferase